MNVGFEQIIGAEGGPINSLEATPPPLPTADDHLSWEKQGS